MQKAKTRSYADISRLDKQYFSMRYSLATTAGLLELERQQLVDLLGLWGRPREKSSQNSRPIPSWNVCWLDLVQCQFLTDLGFQHDIESADKFLTELKNRYGIRYPTTLKHLWEEEGLEMVWEIQQNTDLPTELFVVEEMDGELVPTRKAQHFLNRATYDDQGIIEELILLHPNTPGDEPILIKPGRKSGYPTIRAILIEFIGPVYHKYGLEEVMAQYPTSGLTRTEAKAVAEYTATHYIEPMEEPITHHKLPRQPRHQASTIRDLTS